MNNQSCSKDMCTVQINQPSCPQIKQKYLAQTFQKHLAVVQNSSSKLREHFSISSAGSSVAVGRNRPTTGVGAPRLTHFCVHRPAARLCETNSLFSTSRAGSTLWRVRRGGDGGGGALYGITKTMRPYGEQKDLPLAFSAHNNGAAYYAWQRSL